MLRTMEFPPPDELLDRYMNLSPEARVKEFWTVKEISALLGKHESTVRRMASEGKVPFTKVGGTIYVALSELKQALRQRVLKD